MSRTRLRSTRQVVDRCTQLAQEVRAAQGRTDADAIDTLWRGEALGTLLWALGIAELPPYDRACDTGAVLTVEEGTTHGGLGSAVLERAARTGRKLRARLLGLPDAFVRHGDARAQRAALGLDPPGIARALDELLGR